jgi:glycosyltransferase involved in cell wall biosynthesis
MAGGPETPGGDVRWGISVVVCAHDEGRWAEMQMAIDSLAEQTVPPHEIILVIDHNERLLRRAQDARLASIVVANSHERGLGGARNTGVDHAGGDVVAFLDDDAAACPTWIESFTETYRDAHVAGVGGAANPRWETERPAWFPPEFDWVVGCSYLGLPEVEAEVRNVFGCNMSFRRDVLTELGGFRLGYGCDETEFCIRLRQRWPDRKVIYLPKASVSHYVPASRTKLRRFLSRCRFEGGSKAVVARLAGREDGLASERVYVRVTLPRGVARGFRDYVLRRDLGGLLRACAIVGGLASTAAGYLMAQMRIEQAARLRGWHGETLRRTSPDRPTESR